MAAADGGGIAAQMAAAPKATPAKVRANKFEAIYPLNLIQFEDDVQDAGKPWNDGTVSQTLAQAKLKHWAGESSPFVSARIVRITKADGSKKLDLQFPSSGGAFRRPMITTPDDEGKREFADYRKLAVARWIEARKAALAAGATKIRSVSTSTGVAASDDLMKELGIE